MTEFELAMVKAAQGIADAIDNVSNSLDQVAGELGNLGLDAAGGDVAEAIKNGCVEIAKAVD